MKKYRINLLPEKEKDFLDKSIYFVLHYLRYVLVLTQIVVIAVFFYRFKVDQEIIDLKDELQQKQEIVAVSEPLLNEAKVVDGKTKAIREVLLAQSQFAGALTYFLDTFPSDLTVKRLEIHDGEFKFEANTRNPEIIRSYTERLKKEKRFRTVTLGTIKRTDDKFVIPLTLSGFQLVLSK
jgi:hypothetical protein